MFWHEKSPSSSQILNVKITKWHIGCETEKVIPRLIRTSGLSSSLDRKEQYTFNADVIGCNLSYKPDSARFCCKQTLQETVWFHTKSKLSTVLMTFNLSVRQMALVRRFICPCPIDLFVRWREFDIFLFANGARSIFYRSPDGAQTSFVYRSRWFHTLSTICTINKRR